MTMTNNATRRWEVRGGELHLNGARVPVRASVVRAVLARAGADGDVDRVLEDDLAARMLHMERTLAVADLERTLNLTD